MPPALWATGGLEAPSFQESFFPEPLFPLGRGLTPPLPLPVDPVRADLGLSGRPSAPQSASKSDPKITQFFDRSLKVF